MPPHEPEYQCQFADNPKLPPETERETAVPEQTAEGLADTPVPAVERLLKLIILLKHDVVAHKLSALIQ